ncbi:D-isomer specific 2-hydroxyacid dehydrogenase family protein [Oceanimonas sp. GK1]|uniref:D-2-hydroxyacid dehydrogenase n=1 Tax=Oceanimonas sp. (strain GK1 / IBRC-M 10197) TaxID=511062 RepID=UPI0002494F4B|nr:D-2-hydroxyacid dehydrogenase [Oceanimonas sp. GK1]AEY00780.1 D-isomer specific 2-hydroxyacid dehydrogenase family protein [Oceanimonas sp. GK1]
MANHTLLLLSQDNHHYRDLLSKAYLPGLTVLMPGNDNDIRAGLERADILLGEPARIRPWLKEARALKWVQSTYAGVDKLLGPGIRQDYLLTNVRGIFGPLVSEYVFAHLLSLTRHLRHYREQQRHHNWQPIAYQSLAGKTLLVLGTGSIGQHVAGTARHFGMQVLGISRTGREAPNFDRTYQPQALNKVLPQADVVVSVLPSTPETRHLFDEERLNHIKPGVVFFNVGRGDAVNETALLHALRSGRIGAAVLDVFATEPLPESSPLWDMPNVVITPHNSGYSFPDQIVTRFSRNYLKFVEGKAMEGVVNFDLGY